MRLSQIQLDITNTCNMKCSHCRNGDITKEMANQLTFEECKKVFDQAYELGCEWVNICGGEPLLHENVFDIIKYISQKSKTILLTNGYLIDDEVAMKLKKSNVTMVQISLDSSVPRKHNELRHNKEAFKHVQMAVQALNKVEIEVCFMVTLSKNNKEEFKDILELANKMNVSFVNFRRLIPQGRGKNNFDDLSLSKEEIDEILYTSKQLESNYRIGICLFPFYFFKDKNVVEYYLKEPLEKAELGCAAGVSALAIASNGDILLCPHIPVVLGNIRDDDIENIWKNNNLINVLRDRKKLKGNCGKCKLSNECGGCRAYPFQMTGDILEEDTLCTEYENICSLDKNTIY